MDRATPLPPLQGHEACNRVNFTFYCSDNLQFWKCAQISQRNILLLCSGSNSDVCTAVCLYNHADVHCNPCSLRTMKMEAVYSSEIVSVYNTTRCPSMQYYKIKTERCVEQKTYNKLYFQKRTSLIEFCCRGISVSSRMQFQSTNI
jgi:CCR4-NOT transcriptional regulation complex NOT5 subunit